MRDPATRSINRTSRENWTFPFQSTLLTATKEKTAPVSSTAGTQKAGTTCERQLVRPSRRPDDAHSYFAKDGENFLSTVKRNEAESGELGGIFESGVAEQARRKGCDWCDRSRA